MQVPGVRLTAVLLGISFLVLLLVISACDGGDAYTPPPATIVGEGETQHPSPTVTRGMPAIAPTATPKDYPAPPTALPRTPFSYPSGNQ